MTHVGRSLVGVAVALALVTSAEALDDVLGWQNTRWGMTEMQARRAVDALGFGVVPATTTDVPFKTRIPVEGQPFDVTFHFLGEPRGLDRVLVQNRDLDRTDAAAVHAGLLRSLTDAHGPPSETVARGTTASMTRWRFKSTTIALSMYTDITVAGRHPTAVSLTYSSALTPATESSDWKVLALGLLRMLGEVRTPR